MMRHSHFRSLSISVASLGLAGLLYAQQPTVRRYSLDKKIGNSEALGATIGLARTFQVSSDGRLFVLDFGDSNVKEYDADGRFVRSYGRKGSGPGELRNPNDLQVTDSEIRIRDLSNGDITFSRAGEVLKAAESPWMNGTLRNGFQLIESRENRLVQGKSPTLVSAPESIVLAIVSANGKADTLGRFEDGTVKYQFTNGRTIKRSANFGATGVWRVIGDSAVVVVNGLTGQVNWFSVVSGQLKKSRTAVLPLRGRPVTKKDVELMEAKLAQATGGFRSDGARSAPSTTKGRIVDPPKLWSMATRIFVDVDGTIWVGAPRNYLDVKAGSQTVEENRWMALKPSGALSVVTLPSTFTLNSVYREALYGLDHTDDEPSITRLTAK